jgi:hypothetical protein
MLVINRLLSRRPTIRRDDDGAVLVAVIGVMLVGFIVAALVASTVVFTIGANDDNRDSLDAFIAAESGRDVAVAAIMAGCTSGALAGTGAIPDAAGQPSGTAYTYSIETTASSVPSDAADPTSLPGLTASCPTQATTRVLITATGTAPDGAETTIDTLYAWDVRTSQSPGGTVAYFDGQFKATKSTYEGDLVIRQNDYECNSDTEIRGDLWAIGGPTGGQGGNVTISTGCVVTGSIYARGTVATKGGGGQGGITIGGDIVAEGDIELDSDAPSLGGSLLSGRNIILKKSGVAEDIKAVGTIEGVDVIDGGAWTSSTSTVEEGAAPPVFEPPLNDVYGMTTWIDLGLTGWSDDADVVNACSLSAAVRKNPIARFDDSARDLVIDYSTCHSDVALGAGPVTRDVALLFAASEHMDIDINGSLTSSADNQILFVHADSVPANKAPNCSSFQGPNIDVDDLDVNSGLNLSDVRIMVYSPCGLQGNLQADFSGQLYTNSDDTRAVSSIFTCTPMSWPTPLNNLSCTIKGDGGAAPTVSIVQRLDDETIIYQTER